MLAPVVGLVAISALVFMKWPVEERPENGKTFDCVAGAFYLGWVGLSRIRRVEGETRLAVRVSRYDLGTPCPASLL